MSCAPKAAAHEPDPAVLDQLLEELDDATYWAESLISAADTIGGHFLDSVRASHGIRFQEDYNLAFLLEEAKCAAERAEALADRISQHLKAGNRRPGGSLNLRRRASAG